MEACLAVGYERWFITVLLVAAAFRWISSDWLLLGALALIAVFHHWRIKRMDGGSAQSHTAKAISHGN